jgi:hypothetical protein
LTQLAGRSTPTSSAAIVSAEIFYSPSISKQIREEVGGFTTFVDEHLKIFPLF